MPAKLRPSGGKVATWWHGGKVAAKLGGMAAKRALPPAPSLPDLLRRAAAGPRGGAPVWLHFGERRAARRAYPLLLRGRGRGPLRHSPAFPRDQDPHNAGLLYHSTEIRGGALTQALRCGAPRGAVERGGAPRGAE
eukprot:gene15113-biopygen13069